MTARPTTLLMSASTRAESINGGLAQLIAKVLAERREHAEIIDLAEYDMPLYHGDVERTDGVPAAAHALVDRFRDVDRLVIVTPEYNGAFPPLLKNTIDWMSRVDRAFMAHLTVHLAAASPGGLGGARVLAITRTWLENIRVTVAPDVLSVPKAALDDRGEFVSEGDVDVDSFLPAY